MSEGVQQIQSQKLIQLPQIWGQEVFPDTHLRPLHPLGPLFEQPSPCRSPTCCRRWWVQSSWDPTCPPSPFGFLWSSSSPSSPTVATTYPSCLHLNSMTTTISSKETLPTVGLWAVAPTLTPRTPDSRHRCLSSNVGLVEGEVCRWGQR